MYDVFFLSYDEPYADGFWAALKRQHPVARRLNGINGIQAAHRRCAEMSRTKYFFVVDADNEIVNPEIFRYHVPENDSDYVHLWYARNPVNDLVYGWGAVKLFPRHVFLNMERRLDMTTGFSLKIIPAVASITHFNCGAFETWRSAFREAVKLTLSPSDESKERLSVWMTEAKGAFADMSLKGAKDGHKYALSHIDDFEAQMRINDYGWLSGLFLEGWAG